MGVRRFNPLDRVELPPRFLAAFVGRRQMKVLYFAWLRERLNRASDEVTPPPEVVTLADLVAWLRERIAREDGALGTWAAN